MIHAGGSLPRNPHQAPTSPNEPEGWEGWEGSTNFLAATTWILRPTNTDFFEEVKSTPPPLPPKGVGRRPDEIPERVNARPLSLCARTPKKS